MPDSCFARALREGLSGQPVFQGEYPGRSFEPGFLQALLFYEGERVKGAESGPEVV
jgi:hypothetical protein